MKITVMNLYADILIVTATKVESKAIVEVFQDTSGHVPEPIPIRDRMYHNLGIINGASVFMVQSEMGAGGLGSSLLTVQKGIVALSPSAVIMVGIAFGVNSEKQSVGDVLVSQRLMLYELQRVNIGEGGLRLKPRGDRPHASPQLFDRFRSADLYWDESKAKIHFGLILSGEKLVDNIDFRQQLREFEPEAIGGEMEGAGLYVACQDAKVDWILVKSICDWADGYKVQNKDEQQRLAAHNAASFVLHVLQHAPLKLEGERRKPVPSTLPNDKANPAQVTILLNKDIHEFTPDEQASFVFTLSRIVNVTPDQIQILRVIQGSVLVTLEMPEEAVKILLSLFSQQSSALQALQITKVELKQPNETPWITMLYIGNLTLSTTESDLRMLFEQAGKVTQVALIKDRYTGQSRGFAFVEMDSKAEAEKAIALFNGSLLHHRALRVNLTRPSESRARDRFNTQGDGPPKRRT